MSDLLLKVAELNKKYNETSPDTPAGYELRVTLKASIAEAEKVILYYNYCFHFTRSLIHNVVLYNCIHC